MIGVIGSGLGGLAAAVTLARAGRPVVVFEQHHEPGGFATHFRRGAYTFDASLHALDGVGPGQPNRRLFERLGMLEHLELRPIPTDRRERWLKAGLDLRVPHGTEAYLRAFAEHFPRDVEGARALLALAERVHASVYAWMESGDERPGPEAMSLMSKTVQQLLEEKLQDPRAVRFLSSMTTYLGLSGERLGAMSYLIILHGYYGLDAAYPVGGSHALARALVTELERHGGRLVLGAPVQRVLCQRRRVRGLIVGPQPDGEEHAVQAVIANCSPLRTFGQLLAERDVPPRLLAQIRGLELSASASSLHLGVRDVAGLPWHPYETFLHEIDHPLLPTGRVSLTARHLVDPAACPPGHGLLEIATAAPNQEELALSVPGIREALLDVVEQHLLPGLRGRIEVEALVHPGTFIRYTGTPSGATFGFAMTPAQSGVRGLQVRTAVEGLYQAGGWIRPGAGQTAVMLSGWQAGRAVLEDLPEGA